MRDLANFKGVPLKVGKKLPVGCFTVDGKRAPLRGAGATPIPRGLGWAVAWWSRCPKGLRPERGGKGYKGP